MLWHRFPRTSGGRRHIHNVKKIVFPHQLALMTRASLSAIKKNPPRITRRLLKTHVSHRDPNTVSVYSQIFCCYSRAAPD